MAHELVVQKAQDLVVTEENYEESTRFLKGVVELKNQINSHYEASVKKAHEAHKAMIAAKKEHLAPLEEAIQLTKKALVAYEGPADKVSGVSYVETWTYKVIDAPLIPKEYWMLDEKKLAGMVKSMGEMTNIPGIKPVKKRMVRINAKI